MGDLLNPRKSTSHEGLSAMTTNRFMVAAPSHASQLPRLAFEQLWRGLLVMNTADPEE